MQRASENAIHKVLEIWTNRGAWSDASGKRRPGDARNRNHYSDRLKETPGLDKFSALHLQQRQQPDNSGPVNVVLHSYAGHPWSSGWTREFCYVPPTFRTISHGEFSDLFHLPLTSDLASFDKRVLFSALRRLAETPLSNILLEMWGICVSSRREIVNDWYKKPYVAFRCHRPIELNTAVTREYDRVDISIVIVVVSDQSAFHLATHVAS